MLPEHTLSTQVMFDAYLPPDDRDPMKYVDYEMGGIGLNDASTGMTVQIWKLELFKDVLSDLVYVYVSAPNTPRTLLFSRDAISEACLAFDQNMNPFVAFVAAGQATFWWYDTSVAAQIFTDLPVGARSPKCALDDKRLLSTGTSDIILGYVNGETLYFREQRDRYEIEYTLATGITTDLMRIGMNEDNRLQFAYGVYGEDYPMPTTADM